MKAPDIEYMPGASYQTFTQRDAVGICERKISSGSR